MILQTILNIKTVHTYPGTNVHPISYPVSQTAPVIMQPLVVNPN
jgi:hypothetical protein